jgi:predicted acetyltransferase
VCDEDNYASEKIILKNGGVLENTLYDPEEAVTVKRYWIDL